MRLRRLGAMHQTRLSFVRQILRKVAAEQWTITTACWDIDSDGYGTCIYAIDATDGERYSLVIFSNPLPDQLRSDRVIADQWDLAFVLYDGDPSDAELAQLREQVPKQEIGRFNPKVLVLARANKSGRNFDTIINALAQGKQPDTRQLACVGYLYRTTAVYGNGKFGIADFGLVAQRRSFNATFSAQMFAVYLMRHFSIQQANWLAKQRGGDQAVPLSAEIATYLGIGNATGLGMAPFLVTHPKLLNAWIASRETAIARIMAQSTIGEHEQARFRELLTRAITHVSEIETVHPLQQESNRQLLQELHILLSTVSEAWPFHSWQALSDSLSAYHEETQELVNTLLLELYPALVDDLADRMSADEDYTLQPDMRLDELQSLIEANYKWAIETDFALAQNQHFFWYQSERKEEPRLGVRLEEEGAERERPLGIGREVNQCYQLMLAFSAENPTTLFPPNTIDFLLAHPEQRGIVRRIQSLAAHPYGEIRDNLLAADCLPIHMLRCKLSFFGAGKFDPRSNLWVRITLFQGAPLVHELNANFTDDWNFPTRPVTA